MTASIRIRIACGDMEPRFQTTMFGDQRWSYFRTHFDLTIVYKSLDPRHFLCAHLIWCGVSTSLPPKQPYLSRSQFSSTTVVPHLVKIILLKLLADQCQGSEIRSLEREAIRRKWESCHPLFPTSSTPSLASMESWQRSTPNKGDGLFADTCT